MHNDKEATSSSSPTLVVGAFDKTQTEFPVIVQQSAVTVDLTSTTSDGNLSEPH